MNDHDSNFLLRWSRRKAQVRQGIAPTDAPEPVPAQPAVAAAAASTPPQAEPSAEPAIAAATPAAPTLADVAALSPQSDYTRFVAEGVAPEVKNAALKKLFTDPHFNLMDGLDTYIDDYGQPDPLPAGMLRKMAQSQLLGLFVEEGKTDAAETPQPAPTAVTATPGPEPADDAAPHPANS